MTRARLFLILAVHVAVGTGLLVWAILETRRQQVEIEASLVSEASILADSLGPGLAAASNAVREFEEIVTWKLLDNARLLAEIEASGMPSESRVDAIVEANGLDTAAFVTSDGKVRRVFAEDPTPRMLAELEALLSGQAEELVLGSALEGDTEHVAAAVRTATGGAVLVSIHAAAARTFVARLGVENLLERLVGTGGVLYLDYREDPGGLAAAASWDGGPIPQHLQDDSRLHLVRDRLVFETAIPVDAPAGGRASLRIGLDGVPMEQAAATGVRRTLVVGIVLVGYALATVSFALVSRVRGLEKEEAARRLAEAEAARRSSERLAAAGALTAGLAHEVRNPLNAIGLAAQRLERKHPESDDCGAFARSIRREVGRLEGILREFLDLARPVGDRAERVELARVAAEVIELLRPDAESRGVRIRSVEGEAALRGDREAIRRSVINLINNAVAASPDGGEVSVIVDREGGQGRLRVLDQGPGVDPAVEDKAFEAFVTNRADGAGLGLSLVKRVAEEHGGSCSLTNGDGGGAVACLCLPLEGESNS